ncbi:hypothetical protein QA601_11865 [Chitinispirillales bacterium ANBcel5]|uniref:hypothetical protein n=1 Tax=Cellulosispirillum alkaliphilum TaxID=3039283 RepID=UPI002A4EB3AF|nr:hypothetical protein [Chitinispirillales bacterium ANBcel5]
MHTEQLRPKRKSQSDPFASFEPVKWRVTRHGDAALGDEIYSLKRNHGIPGAYKLHNLNDAINDDRNPFEKVLVEYLINDCRYEVFTVSDLLNSPYPFDKAASGNILGEIAERIARRITKYFLKHWSKKGRTGGIFDKSFDPQNRDDFIVANTDNYVLKIQHYPNLIILRCSGRGKYGYENIKELDGFFDYRYMGQRHILVLESKLEKINVNCDDLTNNLFSPLAQLFPEAKFSYVLFTDRHSVLTRNCPCKRQIKHMPLKIYEHLKAHGIGTLFFTFNETRDDFERIKDFLITQYRAIMNLGVTFRGKTVLTDRELMVFDGGETPHIKLLKDLETGMWREVPLRHKR